MRTWIKNSWDILLIALIALAFFSADGIHVIDYPPRSVHQWRQSDCVAYSLNYYEQNLDFFHPAFYNLISDYGRSVSELPILYYVAGKLYHIVGVHYWVLRGLTFCCYLLGLFYLYRLTRLWIRDPFLQLFPVVLFATTPYFYYYALNTLPNVPAISFSLAGLYYMVRYRQGNQVKHLASATLLFILSSLFKLTDGGLIWMAYGGFTVLNMFNNRNRDKASGYVVIAIVVIGLSGFAWYRYASWYNTVNSNTLNLLGLYPVWDMTGNDIIYTIQQRIFGMWYSSYQYKYILWLLGPIFVTFL